VQRVHRAGHEIMEACVALGGTISGEHGVGTEKLDGMRLVFSEDDLEFQRQLRAAFDPQGLLNPGKLLPPLAKPSRAAGTGSARIWATIRNGLPATFPRHATSCAARTRAGVRCCPWEMARSPILAIGAATATPLRSTRLTAVTEYDPATQVVGVQAGMPLAQLQATLAEHGQWLPLRPPLGERRTLGGIAALNACGPERLRYGAPRDLLLGLKFISGTGRQISAGGRVMKNVAGYDVTRLLAGSAGTLGFITELTFRIQAVPACCAAVRGDGTLEQIEAAAGWLLQSKLEPNFVVAAGSGPAAAGGVTNGRRFRSRSERSTVATGRGLRGVSRDGGRPGRGLPERTDAARIERRAVLGISGEGGNLPGAV
jgi:FAD/FMN-containing dehydrogenase